MASSGRVFVSGSAGHRGKLVVSGDSRGLLPTKGSNDFSEIGYFSVE
jgi:hypothetical protein